LRYLKDWWRGIVRPILRSFVNYVAEPVLQSVLVHEQAIVDLYQENQDVHARVVRAETDLLAERKRRVEDTGRAHSLTDSMIEDRDITIRQAKKLWVFLQSTEYKLAKYTPTKSMLEDEMWDAVWAGTNPTDRPLKPSEHPYFNRSLPENALNRLVAGREPHVDNHGNHINAPIPSSDEAEASSQSSFDGPGSYGPTWDVGMEYERKNEKDAAPEACAFMGRRGTFDWVISSSGETPIRRILKYSRKKSCVRSP